MSAFILGNKHISAMLQHTGPQFQGDSVAYYWEGTMHYVNGRQQTIGQILLNENYCSVNYRYDESKTAADFKQVFRMRRYSPVEIISLCDCYRYQTCEAPDWKDTEAYAIMQALRERAIQQLPGYDKATWVIYDK